MRTSTLTSTYTDVGNNFQSMVEEAEAQIRILTLAKDERRKDYMAALAELDRTTGGNRSGASSAGAEALYQGQIQTPRMNANATIASHTTIHKAQLLDILSAALA